MKKYHLFSEKNNLTNEILNDGRMAWVDGSDLYVEDDWENVTGTSKRNYDIVEDNLEYFFAESKQDI